jgi:hypothetical protein
VVLAFVQFINSFATFKMISAEQARLFKLCQHTVDRGQADVGILKKKLLVNIFSGHVPLGALLKDLQNLLAGNGGFESGTFEFVHGIDWQMKGGIGEFDSQEPNATATMTSSYGLPSIHETTNSNFSASSWPF